MIRLFINKYIDKNPERQKELDYCFEKNESNGLLGEIHQTYERLSYNDFFRWINTIVGDEDISIIANSDIYFDETLIDIIKINHDECYALSRWDAKEDGSIELWDHRDSQDVWIFKGKIKEVLGADFSQGIPGCDNSIAYLLNAVGYKVLNPSKTIRAIHVHNSGIRNYEQHDVDKQIATVPPPYHFIAPHEL